MIKNTLENKKKFAALYLNQNVLRYHSWKSVNTVTHSDNTIHRGHKVDINSVNENSYLELKSLQDISDEDAIEVAKIINMGADIEDISKRKFSVWVIDNLGVTQIITKDTGYYGDIYYMPYEDENEILGNSINFLEAYQYLISKSYLLPFRGVNVRTLIEWGWSKLENK